MNCPKCGKEMIYGKIGISAGSKGLPSSMFWAPNEVFNKHASQFLTLKKVLAEGGIVLPLPFMLLRHHYLVKRYKNEN